MNIPRSKNTGERDVVLWKSTYKHMNIHYTRDFFLQKQQIRAARDEGVIFFSLSLQGITKIMQTKEKQGLHL